LLITLFFILCPQSPAVLASYRTILIAKSRYKAKLVEITSYNYNNKGSIGGPEWGPTPTEGKKQTL